MAESPLSASTLGDLRWNDRWDDLSLAAVERRHRHRQALLDELAAIPRDRLSPADRTHYDVFRHQYATAVEAHAHRYHLVRVATYDGVQNAEQLVDNLRFAGVGDYQDWLARLDGFPAYMAQNIELMREGIRTETRLPAVIVERVLAQVRMLASQPPEQSGFFKPFARFPDGIGDADRQRLRREGRARVRDRVAPAFAALQAFLED